MATVRRFEDLEIWQLSRKIYQKVSVIAESLRNKHEYRFADQIRSAAVVMDNIAEGFERNGRLEFLNSLSISKGESGDVKSQLYRCLDDAYLDQHEFNDLYNDVDLLGKKI